MPVLAHLRRHQDKQKSCRRSGESALLARFEEVSGKGTSSVEPDSRCQEAFQGTYMISLILRRNGLKIEEQTGIVDGHSDGGRRLGREEVEDRLGQR